MAKAYSTPGAPDKLWRSNTSRMPTKMKIINTTTVFSTALYSCETWTFTAKIRRMLLAFESKYMLPKNHESEKDTENNK